MKIKVDNENCIPYKKYATDAGWDLKVNRDMPTMIYHNKLPVTVNTGVHVEIPKGYVGMIFPRSGIASQFEIVLANTVGIIDSDYRGEILVNIVNKGNRHYKLGPYERICQLLVVPIYLEDLEIVEELNETQRGNNGFGSTGTNTQKDSTEVEDTEEGVTWDLEKLSDTYK